MQQMLCRHFGRGTRDVQRAGKNRRACAFVPPTYRWGAASIINTSTRQSSNASGAFDRNEFEHAIKRNLFYIPAFDIYQGVGLSETRGLYDYGPPGCGLQANIIDTWRKHFVLEEDMLEVDCTSLTPHEVLKTSGHVDRFTDWICTDSKTGESFRADHLIKETLKSRLEKSGIAGTNVRGGIDERSANGPDGSQLDARLRTEYEAVLAEIDSYNGEDLFKAIEKYSIQSPSTGGVIDRPVPFNLMFETKIGPKSQSTSGAPSFLRPETAQGQFLNFQKLFDYNRLLMPFASASVGKCYRNEISPRSGLLRVREFLLAEVEHYVDPNGGKCHSRFSEVANVELRLLAREAQTAKEPGEMHITVADAVSEGIVNNQTLGYFLARTQLFLVKCGIDAKRLRFRQHMAGEMAHYATDCWDAELLTSYGWIEAVGCADRAAYDLTVHSHRTGRPLVVREPLDQQMEVEQYEVDINRRMLGSHFKGVSKVIDQTLQNLDQQALERLALDLSKVGEVKLQLRDGLEYVTLNNDMISIRKRTHTVSHREYVPSVIEPSFGIGRILYGVLEHSWWARSDGRNVLSLAPSLAPLKVLVAPLSRHEELVRLAKRITSRLKAMGISSRLDTSNASIGKRYARADEVGTLLGVTVDFQSINDGSLTLRDRDTLHQVRGNENQICEAVATIVRCEESWEEVADRLPKFEQQQIE